LENLEKKEKEKKNQPNSAWWPAGRDGPTSPTSLPGPACAPRASPPPLAR